MDEYERVTTRETVDTPVEEVTDETVVRRPANRVVRPAAERVETTEHEYVVGPSPSELARRVVALLFGILQALIVLRVILLLLVANRDNGIVQLILALTQPFVEPFRGMFQLDSVTARGTGSVLDVAAIVALIGWTLVEALVLAIVSLPSRRPTTYP